MRSRAASRLKAAYELLCSEPGAPGWEEWWPAGGPFERIVGAVLTQQTRWENVDRALGGLKEEGFLAPDAMASAPVETLESIIRPVGFYRQKALYLKGIAAYCARCPVERMCTLPPEELRKELLGLHGIGNETADVIMLYVAGRPRLVLDAYARRLLGCLGIGGGYEELQALSGKALGDDAETYQRFHALIVEHGKRHCNKKRCDACPFRKERRAHESTEKIG